MQTPLLLQKILVYYYFAFDTTHAMQPVLVFPKVIINIHSFINADV